MPAHSRRQQPNDTKKLQELAPDDCLLRWVQNDLDYLAYDWRRPGWIPVEKPKNALQFDEPVGGVSAEREGGEMSTYLRRHLENVHSSSPESLVDLRSAGGLVYEAQVEQLVELGLTPESTPDGAEAPGCAHVSVYRPKLDKPARQSLYNRLSKAMTLVAGDEPPPPPLDSQ